MCDHQLSPCVDADVGPMCDVVPPEKNRFDCLMRPSRRPVLNRLGGDRASLLPHFALAARKALGKQVLGWQRSSLREASVAFLHSCSAHWSLVRRPCEFRGVTLASAVV